MPQVSRNDLKGRWVQQDDMYKVWCVLLLDLRSAHTGVISSFPCAAERNS